MNEHLKDMSLLELFRMEAESQLAILTEGLLASERGETNSLEQIMRAAHSS
jgi:two-component system sensor histidine kinase and response regulator WspE